MAQFTRTHGDYQPVMNFDQPAYQVGAVNAVTSGDSVQPQGPKLDFFTVTASGSSTFSTTQINVIVETVQQLATIYLYEYYSGTPDTFALAVYPTGAWTPTSMTTAVNAALTAAGVANTTAATSGASFIN
jgi:hypothetical protein